MVKELTILKVDKELEELVRVAMNSSVSKEMFRDYLNKRQSDLQKKI